MQSSLSFVTYMYIILILIWIFWEFGGLTCWHLNYTSHDDERDFFKLSQFFFWKPVGMEQLVQSIEKENRKGLFFFLIKSRTYTIISLHFLSFALLSAMNTTKKLRLHFRVEYARYCIIWRSPRSPNLP